MLTPQNCPFARHSTLPELQNLVRFFRPRALSPNCLTPDVRGLDYYLLPEYLSDCVAEGAYDTMVTERDRYFVARWGQSYLDQLAMMRTAGTISDTGIATLKYEAEPSLAIKAEELRIAIDMRKPGRQAGSTEQLHRLGGFPALPLTELVNLLNVHPEAALDIAQNSISTLGGPNRQRTGSRYKEDDDYDTDDEKRCRPVKRGRQAAGFPVCEG